MTNGEIYGLLAAFAASACGGRRTIGFHMLGNEPEILDSKFEDDTTLSLWTNQKVRKLLLEAVTYIF